MKELTIFELPPLCVLGEGMIIVDDVECPPCWCCGEPAVSRVDVLGRPRGACAACALEVREL